MNIEEILKDEAFTAQLKVAESLDEVVRLCKAKGIEVTAAELEAAMKAEEGELDAGELDNVAGGTSIAAIKICALMLTRFIPHGGPIRAF